MSSVYGIVHFGVLEPTDQRVEKAFKVSLERLHAKSDIGGYVRYEHDKYYKPDNHPTPNPWCITTLWVAQHYIKSAKKKKDLEPAKESLEWVYDRATAGGILPEKVDPYTGEHLSTAPLVWSHAEYVITVDEYVKKYKILK